MPFQHIQQRGHVANCCVGALCSSSFLLNGWSSSLVTTVRIEVPLLYVTLSWPARVSERGTQTHQSSLSEWKCFMYYMLYRLDIRIRRDCHPLPRKNDNTKNRFTHVTYTSAFHHLENERVRGGNK